MKLLVLIGATVLCWVMAAGVAAAADGSGHWLPSGLAVLLCLLPAVGTLIAAGVTERRAPALAIGFILVAPFIRLIAVLLIGGLIGLTVPAIKAEPAKFVFWVAGFYLVTLIVETAVLLTGVKSKVGSPPADAPSGPTAS